MTVAFGLCQLASQLLQLLFRLGTRGSLSVNFPKRPVLRFGRSLGGFINSCTSFFQLGAEMLPALRLLQLQLIHLPGQRLTSRCTRSVRTPFLLKLCSKGLSSGLQFGDFGLCGLYLGLQDGASLQSLLQAWLYSETMDRRVWAAMLLLLAGGMALVLDQGLQGGVQLMGLLAVLLATVAWGVDNTLSRGLAERDPSQVVMAKATLGAVVTAALAVSTGEPWPSLSAALGLLAVGATGYGLSLRFYLLAQRAFGAARTGSVFAFAPFIGAAVAFGFGDRPAGLLMLLGGVLMLAGVVLHLAESHGHEHTHEVLEHEHAHRHDDGHHSHVHDVMPKGSHSHKHTHEPMTHAHPHAPDVHHQHVH